jgi:pyridoxine kinase
MGRILAISSQVVYGPVGNTAAVPAMQAMGHEVMQVPTVLLSHHPGHGQPAGQSTAPHVFEALLKGIETVGALKKLDAVMTGYFANVSQIRAAAQVIRAIKPKHVLVDPVMGDQGALYVPRDIAVAIRDELLPLATIATPNLYELCWLMQSRMRGLEDVVRAARSLNCPEVLVTSTEGSTKSLGTLLVRSTKVEQSESVRLPNVPNGTGDFLAGLYLAQRLRYPPAASFRSAMRDLNHAISLSGKSGVLAVAQALTK